MSENRRRHIKALYTFDAVVRRVPEERWDHPSPCPGWSARQVVSHLVYILPLWIGEDAPEGDEIGLADHDPSSVWAAALDHHLARIDDEHRLGEVVNTNMGPMPLDTSLGILLVDPLIHAWDLATAAGIEAWLPADLCGNAYDVLAFARSSIDAMFAPATIGADEHSDVVERMLRMSGRNPNRHG